MLPAGKPSTSYFRPRPKPGTRRGPGAPGRRNWSAPGSTAASPARAHDRGRSPPPAHKTHQAERAAVPALASLLHLAD